MFLIKRLSLTWYGFKRLVTFRAVDEAIPKLADLQKFIPKLDALQEVLTRLDEMERRMPDEDTVAAISSKLNSLDSAVHKIETLTVPVLNQAPIPVKTKELRADSEIRHDWQRLKMLSQFSQMAGKAKQIEQEWQKIQQDEHDEFFKFQTLGKSAELEYIYKKGISEGIKWCVNQFC